MLRNFLSEMHLCQLQLIGRDRQAAWSDDSCGHGGHRQSELTRALAA